MHSTIPHQATVLLLQTLFLNSVKYSSAELILPSFESKATLSTVEYEIPEPTATATVRRMKLEPTPMPVLGFETRNEEVVGNIKVEGARMKDGLFFTEIEGTVGPRLENGAFLTEDNLPPLLVLIGPRLENGMFYTGVGVWTRDMIYGGFNSIGNWNSNATEADPTNAQKLESTGTVTGPKRIPIRILSQVVYGPSLPPSKSGFAPASDSSKPQKICDCPSNMNSTSVPPSSLTSSHPSRSHPSPRVSDPNPNTDSQLCKHTRLVLLLEEMLTDELHRLLGGRSFSDLERFLDMKEGFEVGSGWKKRMGLNKYSELDRFLAGLRSPGFELVRGSGGKV